MSENDKLAHRRPDCKKCGKKGIRSSQYDSVYCPHCNIWLETACSDPKCEFCKDRPETPIKMEG